MRIGERLKRLRINKGYTLEHAGKRVGISKQTLYKYENSIITNIPSDKIELLAGLYDSTPQYIMGWGKEPETKTEAFVQMAYNKLKESGDPKDRAIVEAVNQLLGINGHENDE